MKSLDRVLQKWRIRQALKFIPSSARVIDVGAHQGELFDAMGPDLKEGFGVEPLLSQQAQSTVYSIHPGFFPQVYPPTRDWDAVTMLAVLEHIPRHQQSQLADACYELLYPNGRVIITVPSKIVDFILAGLRMLRLIDGMSLEEHYGFEPHQTIKIFREPNFRLLNHIKFQLGLNHLYVFEKVAAKL